MVSRKIKKHGRRLKKNNSVKLRRKQSGGAATDEGLIQSWRNVGSWQSLGRGIKTPCGYGKNMPEQFLRKMWSAVNEGKVERMFWCMHKPVDSDHPYDKLIPLLLVWNSMKGPVKLSYFILGKVEAVTLATPVEQQVTLQRAIVAGHAAPAADATATTELTNATAALEPDALRKYILFGTKLEKSGHSWTSRPCSFNLETQNTDFIDMMLNITEKITREEVDKPTYGGEKLAAAHLLGEKFVKELNLGTAVLPFPEEEVGKGEAAEAARVELATEWKTKVAERTAASQASKVAKTAFDRTMANVTKKMNTATATAEAEYNKEFKAAPNPPPPPTAGAEAGSVLTDARVEALQKAAINRNDMIANASKAEVNEINAAIIAAEEAGMDVLEIAAARRTLKEAKTRENERVQAGIKSMLGIEIQRIESQRATGGTCVSLQSSSNINKRAAAVCFAKFVLTNYPWKEGEAWPVQPPIYNTLSEDDAAVATDRFVKNALLKLTRHYHPDTTTRPATSRYNDKEWEIISEVIMTQLNLAREQWIKGERGLEGGGNNKNLKPYKYTRKNLNKPNAFFKKRVTQIYKKQIKPKSKKHRKSNKRRSRHRTQKRHKKRRARRSTRKSHI